MIKSMEGEMERTLKFFSQMSDLAFQIGKWLLVTTMFGISFFVLLQVFFRYVLNHALLWPEELSRWLLVWTGYLGAGVALKRHEHVALTVFVTKFPPKLARVTLFLGRLLFLIFILYFTYFGWTNMVRSNQYSWAIMVSFKWVMTSVPVCGLLMLIHILYFILQDISDFLTRSDKDVRIEC